MNSNIEQDLAVDQGKKELDDITDYQADLKYLRYTLNETWPDMLYVIPAVSGYNSQTFTHEMTSAMRVLQYRKAATHFRLHFNSISISIGTFFDFGIVIVIGISICTCI